MLIFKSKKRGLLIGTLLIMALHSLNTIFLSIIIGRVLTAAENASLSDFYLSALIGVAGFILFMVLGVLMAKCRVKLTKHVNLRIKERAIKEIITNTHFMEDYTKELSFLTNDLKQLETKGIEGELNIFYLGCTYVFALIGAFNYDVITALAFLLGSLIAVVISLFLRKSVNESAQYWTKDNARYIKILKNILSGFETVRTYQVQERISEDALGEASNMETSLEKMNFKVEVSNQLVYIGMMLFGILLPFAVGIFRVITVNVPLASFISIVYLSNGLRTPALQLLQQLNGYKTTKPIKERYFKLERASKLPSNEVVVTDEFKEIALQNISFNYQTKALFKKQSFSVKKGEKILVVGESGIGKSTLLRLLQTTLKVQEGTYLYNRNPLNGDISHIFSLIRQQPLIFDDTLLFNITLGEDYPLEDINFVLKQVDLATLVDKNGLNYTVGENGANLSGGELQRIEIARALIRKRPIILADEITSALDPVTASFIRNVLQQDNITLIEVRHDAFENGDDFYTQTWDLSKVA